MSTLLVRAPRAALATDRRLRSAAMALGLVLLALPWLAATPDAARPVPISDTEQLRRALLEARDNCLVAALAARGHAVAPPLFRTVELRRALRSDLLQLADLGELPAIEHEATWLAELRGTPDLGARSWEDVRFLTGALHGYLEASAAALDAVARMEGEPGPAGLGRWARHRLSVEDLDPEALREFRGMSVEDLLGVWD